LIGLSQAGQKQREADSVVVGEARLFRLLGRLGRGDGGLGRHCCDQYLAPVVPGRGLARDHTEATDERDECLVHRTEVEDHADQSQGGGGDDLVHGGDAFQWT